jgi:CDGSH-type Zn-finger protein
MTTSDDEPTAPVRLRLRANGPLLVHGAIEIVTESGDLIRAAESTALCRCGASREMPFCDGSHRVTLFRDS